MNIPKMHSIYAMLVAIIFSLIVVAASVFALKQVKSESTSTIRNALQTVLYAVQEAHNILITQRKRAIVSIVESDDIIALTEQLLTLHSKKSTLINSSPLLQLREVIMPTLQKFGDLGFFIIAPDRTSIASSRDKNIGSINLIHLKKQKLLDRAFSGETILVPPIQSDVALTNETGHMKKNTATMFIASPIYSSAGAVIAVLTLRVDPIEHFSNITKLGRIGETGETYAFNKEGVLLTESRFIHHLNKTNLVKLGQSGILTLRVSDPGGNLLDGYLPTMAYNDFPLTKMAQSATQGHNSFNIDGYRDYRGVKVLGAWTWDDDFDFGLTTEIDEKEAMQAYYETRFTIILVLCFTVALCLFLLLIIVKIQSELNKRVLRMNAELESRVKQRTEELVTAQQELSQAFNELEVLSVTDSLTSLANRRRFDTNLESEWQRCLRDSRPISLILLDIDYFKQYNDTYGHPLGDTCLKRVAIALASVSIGNRPSDLVARYGGEEFVILLGNTDNHYAQKAAEAVRLAIVKLGIPHKKNTVIKERCVTVSAGYVTLNDLKGHSKNELVEMADKALYRAKDSGRNQVCNFTQEPQ